MLYEGVLPGPKLPFWGCSCGESKNWASRLACRWCGKGAAQSIADKAKHAAKQFEIQGPQPAPLGGRRPKGVRAYGPQPASFGERSPKGVWADGPPAGGSGAIEKLRAEVEELKKKAMQFQGTGAGTAFALLEALEACECMEAEKGVVSAAKAHVAGIKQREEKAAQEAKPLHKRVQTLANKIANKEKQVNKRLASSDELVVAATEAQARADEAAKLLAKGQDELAELKQELVDLKEKGGDIAMAVGTQGAQCSVEDGVPAEVRGRPEIMEAVAQLKARMQAANEELEDEKRARLGGNANGGTEAIGAVGQSQVEEALKVILVPGMLPAFAEVLKEASNSAASVDTGSGSFDGGALAGNASTPGYKAMVDSVLKSKRVAPYFP